MLSYILCLAASVLPAIAAVTSGLYHIESKYYISNVISQNGGDIALHSLDQGRLEQLWSLVITNNTGTIQNVGTKAFFSVDANGTVVPSAKPHNWTITPDTPSNAGIVSNGKAVYTGLFESDSLGVFDSSNEISARWNFVPAVPQPHAYRVWNQAANLYIDRAHGECDYPCILATALNVSSQSQVWHVAGTTCGGRPILENAASKDFIARGSDNTITGTRAVPSSYPQPWAYGFVGGQLTLHDKDLIEDITTLTIYSFEELYWVDLLPTNFQGPGTAPEQTWVFIPV